MGYRLDFAIIVTELDPTAEKEEGVDNLVSFVSAGGEKVLAPQITVYGDTIETLFEDLNLHLNGVKGFLYK